MAIFALNFDFTFNKNAFEEQFFAGITAILFESDSHSDFSLTTICSGHVL